MTETNDSRQAVFNVERVYCKDISFESPAVPYAFQEQSAPSINVQLNIDHSVLDDGEGLYEVVLMATVTAKQSDKALFLVELQQLSGFELRAIDAGRKGAVAHSELHRQNALFELITNLRVGAFRCIGWRRSRLDSEGQIGVTGKVGLLHGVIAR